MVHRHPRRLLLLGPCAVPAFGTLAACGDDDEEATEAAYCTAWSDVRTSLDELVTTLTSTDLPVDRREEVRAATEAVDAAWDDLLAKADADCG